MQRLLERASGQSELNQFRRLASRRRASVVDEAAAFRSEAAVLRMDIVQTRMEISETMHELRAYVDSLR